jgi:uncharacterized protein (DUF1501 family)
MEGRRTFLKAGACALLATVAPPRFLFRTVQAAEGRRRVLVAVFQRGAVDGLSMVVPYGDGAYRAVRPTIAIQAPRPGDSEGARDLDGFFAFHPAMAPLMPLWNNRSLAVVDACGSPDTTRSHFDAQDYMESGTPGIKSTPDGWLARALRMRPSEQDVVVRAVAMGASMPRALRGEPNAIVMRNVRDFDVRTGAQSAARHGFESLYEQGIRDLLQGTGRETFEAVKALKRVNVSEVRPANGAAYPRGQFGEALRQIAQLIRAEIGLEVAFADSGGWDTHVGQGNEKGQLATRLQEFAGALAAFAQDLGDRMADVVVLTMSEFGRTVSENGNRGTDHGHATAMLILGGSVRGGKVYGRWPGLAREQLYENRDLAVTTDFRMLFGEVATRHLGVAAVETVFPGWVPSQRALGLFASA